MYFILSFCSCVWQFHLIFPSTEFEYLRLQYWATFSCCFSVLGSLGFIVWKLSNNIQAISSRSGWIVKFSLSCLALCATVSCVLFATKSQIGNILILLLLYFTCFVMDFLPFGQTRLFNNSFSIRGRITNSMINHILTLLSQAGSRHLSYCGCYARVLLL